MKHIDIAMHWIRQEVRNRHIEVHFLPTDAMVADILTKALPRAAVERHRQALGLM